MILAPSQNPGRPPLSGKWQYNSDGVVLADESFFGLLEKAKTHLISKLYTADEIGQMILTQERLRCPWLVVEIEGKVTMPKHQFAFRTYVQHIGNVEYLDDDDFQKRAEVCAACHYNEAIDIDDEASRLLYLITRGKKTQRLGYCNFYHQPNAIACMIEKMPKDEGKPGSPCWVV